MKARTSMAVIAASALFATLAGATEAVDRNEPEEVRQVAALTVPAEDQGQQLATVQIQEEAEAQAEVEQAAARMAEIRNCATSTGSRLRGNRNCRGVGTISRDDMMNQGPVDSRLIGEISDSMRPREY